MISTCSKHQHIFTHEYHGYSLSGRRGRYSGLKRYELDVRHASWRKGQTARGGEQLAPQPKSSCRLSDSVLAVSPRET